MSELALLAALCAGGLAFAGWLARWLLSCPAGEVEMTRIAAQVQRAAEGFFRRQSSVVGALSALLGVAIFLAYGLLRRAGEGAPVPALQLGVWLTISFALGAALSVATGRVATWVATRAAVRTAHAARQSVDRALQVALRAGAISGLFATSAGLLGLGALWLAVFTYEGGLGAEPADALRLAPTIPPMISGFALGASFAALLAQLGGGTFAKAADLGADIAGREIGLGDDDAQNPATIADLAGDAVGDCAARSSGIFAATVVETLGAMLLGAALYRDNQSLPSAAAVSLFPLVARCFGIVGAIFGVMVVKTDDREDPLAALARGLWVNALLYAVGLAGAAKWLLGAAWSRYLACGVIGVATAVAALFLAQYYTEPRHRPVREIAEASRGGPALMLLAGISHGLASVAAPLLLVICASLAAGWIGAGTGLVGGGLYGVAVAVVGMLGTSAYVLAMDAFGPIVDNASGIVEQCIASERPDVRGRTFVLDVTGNTTKAHTRVWAGIAAGLSALPLVCGFLDEVARRARLLHPEVPPTAGFVLRVDDPAVAIGAAAGVGPVLWFVARSVDGVARTARRLVDEVRRQAGGLAARESRPGGAGRFVPDHEACVEMLARAALRQMIAPGLVAVAVPVAVGLGLRFAKSEDNARIAVDAVAALVMAGTIAGVLGSLFLGNLGSVWDNAKKYIVTGAHGGRYLVEDSPSGARTENPAYGAAAVADSVGDPLKDTAGPAIHVLVKMLCVITLVFLPFFV
ncbi:MAG: sodium/proton-translocating pyrophosphatase [Polyangiaceae bacterium]